MPLITLGAAVLNQTPMDWDGNAAHILDAISQARAAGVSVLCLPELCITGYGCEDAFHSPGLQRTAWQVLHEILPHTSGLCVSLGLPLLFENRLYNTAALAVDGRLAGFAAKQNLAGDGLHYEPRWFKPWPAGRRATFVRDNISYPIGDLLFDIGGLRIGFEICEDAWVARRPGSALARNAADIILNPSASHFAFAKRDIRQRFVIEGSRAYGLTYVYANLVGNEAGRTIYDGDALIASNGHLLALGPRLGYRDAILTHATVDTDLTRLAQSRVASNSPPADAEINPPVSAAFNWPHVSPAPARPIVPPAWEQSQFPKEEEFSRAVALGLFDYMRKTRSRGFVLSLSGGADSAACAALVGQMVRFALAELGPHGLAAKLPHVTPPAELSHPGADPAAAWTRRLLLTLYQGTANSGETTRHAAESLARGIGAEHHEYNIEPLTAHYRALAEQTLARPLDWATDDIALQNIQARVRSPGVWMLANLRGALLLSTSNRSEAAVGYCTMDGDTSGGLSPIAGIDKHFLRHWLRWLETTGPTDAHPVPALREINTQQPTAELRPPGQAQTDEADLMPYDLLDYLEATAIRDKKTPAESLALATARFPGYDQPRLRQWTARFYRLWSRNQWKRERYAPSFHLDDRNLDPRSWCRHPILSGGYERELREME